MDAVVDQLHHLMTSPWIYAALFAVAVLDGFFPVVPSETGVITAGVFAASGHPELLPVIAVAAAGAMAGDHISYAIGRSSGRGLIRRLPPGGRRQVAFDRARRMLLRRGGAALIIARYVPGGRTAVTLTTGAIGYPPRRFLAYDALAAGSWAAYSALVGYLGGVAFEDNPIKGVALGLGFALTVTGIVELIRWARGRHDHRPGNACEGVTATVPMAAHCAADRPE
jgi:membrane protein DedA with SNARE-associated domain